MMAATEGESASSSGTSAMQLQLVEAETGCSMAANEEEVGEDNGYVEVEKEEE